METSESAPAAGTGQAAPAAVHRPLRDLYIEATLYGLATGVPQVFLSVFALRLGAPSEAIGLLTALPSLINALALVPASRLLEEQGAVRSPLVVSFFLQGLQYAGIAVVPLAAPQWQTPLLLLLVALGALPSGLYTVLMNDVVAETAPPGQRGRLLGNRQTLIALADGFVVLAGGWFLSRVALPTNYQILFLFVFLIALANLGVVRRLSVRRDAGRSEPRSEARLGLAQLRQLIGDQGQAGIFVRFLVCAFLLLFSGWLPRPLFAIYWVREAGASDAWIGVLTMTSNLLSTVGFLLWGRLAQNLGSRRLLLFGSLGYVIYPILTALSPTPYWLLVPIVSGAITFPPYTLGLMNGLLDVAPAERRASYIAVYTAASSLASFAAPVLSTAVILPLIGIHAALTVGAAARFLGFLSVFALVKKPGV